jgi:hypothetical protein
MAPSNRARGDRSVTIGGDASGNVIQTGDHNAASLSYEQVTLPPPEQVDVRAEIAALREVLAGLATPDRRKVDNAIAEAEEEAAKAEPDKDEVGKALDRALGYAQKAEGFAKVIETLKPHIQNLGSWLGENWYRLLSVVGLSV